MMANPVLSLGDAGGRGRGAVGSPGVGVERCRLRCGRLARVACVDWTGGLDCFHADCGEPEFHLVKGEVP